MKKSQDIFVDKPTTKMLLLNNEKSKSKSNSNSNSNMNMNMNMKMKMKKKMKSSSYVVRSTKRLFKTLSFKQKPAQKKTPSVISMTSSKNVQVSLAPTYDSIDDNAGADQEDDDVDDDVDDVDVVDDDVLSHMSPHAILEMMKEQEEHRLQTEETVIDTAVKDFLNADTADDAVVANEVMVDTPPLPPSQALQRLLVSSMSSSPLPSYDNVMMYVMANAMMYGMVYMVIGIVFNIYYNNNAKYLYEVLFHQENADVLEATSREVNPHDWQDIVATWL
jgi:hypothetical protein